MTDQSETAMCFTIQKPTFDANTRIATFGYTLGELSFTEKLTFLVDAESTSPISNVFTRVLNQTALVLGTSYYKLKAPFDIDIPNFDLTKTEQAFALDLYENGLAEFYTRNDLKRFGQLRINVQTANARHENETPTLKHRVLLPIGGGKDSLVSVQLLDKAGLNYSPFAVNPKGPILSSVNVIDKTPYYVKRELDPEMIRLGKQPGFYNGHVPSTAINSMIAALTCLLFNFDTIALSNERSASEGNVEFDGRIANHQYSKSIAFEKKIAEILTTTTHGALSYFSLLRPYSEAKIASIFAQETKFDLAFSSCNQNFRLSGHDGPLWCGVCPKCHFTFLMLAPFANQERLNSIFGKNLLEHPDNETPYRELTGLVGHKPWECVGEILEAAACMWHLSKHADWQSTKIVTTLANDLKEQYGEDALEIAFKALMIDTADHHIPKTLFDKVAPYAI